LWKVAITLSNFEKSALPEPSELKSAFAAFSSLQ
jgi:hypothetical protein